MDDRNSHQRAHHKEDAWQAESTLRSNAYSYVKSMALKCAIQLRIPEIIHNHGRPTTLHELMAAVPIPATKAGPLCRLMRLLANSGIFAIDHDGLYALTPASLLLLPRPSGTSMAAYSLLGVELEILNVWNDLAEWYRADGPALMPFEVTHGMNTWDYLKVQPHLQGLLNDAMAGDSELLMDVVVNKCGDVFPGLGSVVDAGGGAGMAAKVIARAFPEMEITVLDLPQAVAGLPKEDDDSGVKFVGGDMFKSIPPTDAVLLKSVMHNWTDEACVEILKKCKEAIPAKEAGGKVIIVDVVLDPSCNDAMTRENQYSLDLLILVCNMGKEREEEEWKKIFEDAGFSAYKLTHVMGYRYVIEVYP